AGDLAALYHSRRKSLQAVLRLAQFLDLAGGAIGLLVPLKVAEEAHELRLDQTRAAPFARPLNGRARRLVDGEEIEPIDLDARHAATRGTIGDVAARHRPGGRGGLGIAVVFGHEDRRQLPDTGEVQGLEDGALVGRPVAEEATADALVPLPFGGERSAADERPATADDAVGAHHANRQIRHVHGAALAVADAGALAPDLRHHGVHV